MTLTYPDPELADEVVRLRPWADDDVSLVAAVSRDPYIPQMTTVPSAYTDELGRAWIARQRVRSTEDEGLSLAVADPGSGEAVGAVFLVLRSLEGVAGVGYWTAEEARGRGLATRAVRLLAVWALTAGGLARVEALVEPWNVPSLRVVERAGFTREGLLRSYVSLQDRRADAVVYSLVVDDLA